ncbi:MAG: hypothetical protein AAF928_03870 [Myxococcota bacterium]
MRRFLLILLSALGGMVASSATSRAQAPTATTTATAPSVEDVAPPEEDIDPEVVALRELAAQIRDLMAGTLALEVDPPSLFEGVDLDDERSVAIEVRRLRLLVEAADPPAAGGAGGRGGGGGGGGGGVGGNLPPADADEDGADAVRWRARLELDRARLDFLGGSATQRRAWRERHRERRLQADEDARRRREAEAQKKEAELALRAAREAERRAENEAQRRVKGEIRRLAEIRVKNRAYRRVLLQREESLDEPLEALLRRQRRVEEAGTLEPAVADGIYVEVVRALSARRADLNARLDRYAADRTDVVPVGDDPLADLDLVDDTEATLQRAEVAAEATTLRTLERSLLAREIEVLVEASRGLNELRLKLLPRISSARRDPLYDFGAPGRDQARAELDLFATVLRYHVAVVTRWFRGLPDASYDDRAAAAWLAFRIAFAGLVYVIWTRRAEALMVAWRRRESEHERKHRTRRGREGLVRFLQAIRRSVEYLVLFLVIRLLLPEEARELDEIMLVEIALQWTLGEVVVVNLVNAVFARQRRLRGTGDASVDRLRLRSLHFVGRWVVAFGLTLSMTEQLVGRGTVYHWVTLAIGVAVVPVLAVVLHGWRPVIASRIAGIPKRNVALEWIHRNCSGALSYAAAALGAVFLMLRAVYRVARSYLGGYDVVRRGLAYWFRRELSREESEAVPPASERRLAGVTFEAFDPDRPAAVIVPSVADAQLDEIVARIDAPGGGVFAIVGERGAGKSSLLTRLELRCRTRRLPCPDRLDDFFAQLRSAYALPDDVTPDDLVGAIESWGADTALLIDDAHHLIRPEIGGLDDFERVLELARRSSIRACTWVFCLDAVIWRFFERARGARPLFDDVVDLTPWSEEGIAGLLTQRTAAAGLEPRFGRLLREAERGGDAEERRAARRRAEQNYYRLLWDYAKGNPGVALEFWRDSLRIDEGGRCWVRLFEPPSTADIESLPDEAVFVLRAVIQLECARVDDIAAATMLSESRIRDALRYAQGRGYVAEVNGRYRVEWRWFRAITSVLLRRHLLTTR